MQILQLQTGDVALRLLKDFVLQLLSCTASGPGTAVRPARAACLRSPGGPAAGLAGSGGVGEALKPAYRYAQ